MVRAGSVALKMVEKQASRDRQSFPGSGTNVKFSMCPIFVEVRYPQSIQPRELLSNHPRHDSNSHACRDHQTERVEAGDLHSTSERFIRIAGGSKELLINRAPRVQTDIIVIQGLSDSSSIHAGQRMIDGRSEDEFVPLVRDR